MVEVELNYRGWRISAEDLTVNPQESRRTLSKKLCEAWEWKQANGALRDMMCGLLLMLERVGLYG